MRSSSRTQHVSQFGWIGDYRELIQYQQSLAATKRSENVDHGKVTSAGPFPALYLKPDFAGATQDYFGLAAIRPDRNARYGAAGRRKAQYLYTVKTEAIGRLWRLGAYRGFCQIPGTSASFSSQRLQRLNARGSSRRNIRSSQCDSAEKQTYSQEDRRVRRCCAKE
jgi:hypothetical protein